MSGHFAQLGTILAAFHFLQFVTLSPTAATNVAVISFLTDPNVRY